jgi:hypothetical protein
VCTNFTESFGVWKSKPSLLILVVILQPIWVAYIYFPVLGFVLAALFCVSCQDPGLMERVVDEEAGEGGWFWNEQVGSFRPPGALYCRECGVSWTNNLRDSNRSSL